VWAEDYTGVDDGPRVTRVALLGGYPEVLDCDCLVVISSYQEDRFRREPERFPAEIAVYDELRRRGRVVTTIEPDRRLAYNWDVLPREGLGSLPLLGRLGPLGPMITVLDLRHP
jgi:hypothetical protein